MDLESTPRNLVATMIPGFATVVSGLKSQGRDLLAQSFPVFMQESIPFYISRLQP